MSKAPCDICMGSKTIKLAVRRPLPMRVPTEVEAIRPITTSSRFYPCPECSNDTPPMEKVAIVREMRQFHTDVRGASYMNHVREVAAHELVDTLIKGGYIHFHVGKTDPDHMVASMTATLGVVAVDHVEKLGDRIAKQQLIVAEEVAREAQREILNWGSHYTGRSGHIGKEQAADYIGEVFKRVSKKWNEAPKAVIVPEPEGKKP